MLGLGLGLQKGGLASWSPLNIPGLKIWLEPDFGISMDADDYEVNSWADRQGYAAFTQTLTRRPLWVASVPAANGRPGVQFDGVNDYMLSNDFVDIPQPLTIIFLATEPTDNDSFRDLFDGLEASKLFLQQRGLTNVYGFFSPTQKSAGAIVAGNPLARWRFEVNGAATDLYKNGAATSEDLSPGTNGVEGFVLGVDYRRDRYFANTTYFLMLIYDHIITADELAQLNIWLVAKFGVGV